MDKPQETFDFSKPEDQKTFDQLPEKEKQEFIDSQMPKAVEEDEERTSANDIMTKNQGDASFIRADILKGMDGHVIDYLDFKVEGIDSTADLQKHKQTICGIIDGISFSVSMYSKMRSYEGTIGGKKIDANDAMAIFEKYIEIAKLASQAERVAKKAADNLSIDLAVGRLLR